MTTTDPAARERSIRALAHDPDDWGSPTNRAFGNIAKVLLDAGVNPLIVADAIQVGYDHSQGLP